MKETIFDYDIKEHELRYLFVDPLDKEGYINNTSEQKKLHHLYILFLLREDKLNYLRIRSRLEVMPLENIDA
jgi:hypothetical protein